MVLLSRQIYAELGGTLSLLEQMSFFFGKMYKICTHTQKKKLPQIQNTHIQW